MLAGALARQAVVEQELLDPKTLRDAKLLASLGRESQRLTQVAELAQEKMERWFLEAGAIATLRQPLGTMGVSTHAYGGTRMGDNPETNVVDRWGFSHEVPNLGILGGSVMGTSGAHNPTLTAQALAWRTAERLGSNWKSIAE